jgi:hypothetical protein
MPSFPDLAALNAWLEEQCIAQWADIQHGVLPGTIADVHADEVRSLMPVGRLRWLRRADQARIAHLPDHLNATVTACRPPSPIVLSACAFTLNGLSWWRKDSPVRTRADH